MPGEYYLNKFRFLYVPCFFFASVWIMSYHCAPAPLHQEQVFGPSLSSSTPDSHCAQRIETAVHKPSKPPPFPTFSFYMSHRNGHPYHKVDSNSIGMTPLTSTSTDTNETSPITAPIPAIPDGRPAGGTTRTSLGGTTRTSGAKTPRKVQWIDESSKHQLAASDTPTRADSIHALDEHGLDVSQSLLVASSRT